MRSTTSENLRHPAVRRLEHPAVSAAPPFAQRGCRVYQWSREAIVTNAPARPGVYGLFNALWIYIGDAADIGARLLEHATGGDPCLVHYRPSGFAFELVDDERRSARRDEIAAQLEPLCNGKSFVHRANGSHKPNC